MSGCCWTDYLFSAWTLGAVAVAYLLYRLGTYNHDYFLKRGVKFIKPLPFLGTQYAQMMGNFFDVLLKDYNSFPNSRFYGTFEFLTPVYNIRDPELIKQIAIKDFDHFVNHRGVIDENIEPLFARNLFSMKDQKWRHMRATLSPAFTGSKMKQMLELIIECAKTSVGYVHGNNKSEFFEIELKDLFTRFASDVIATSAFGIKTNSLQERTNEFYVMGKDISNLEGIQTLKFFGYSCIPAIMKFFRIKLFDSKTLHFFRNLVTGAISYRETNNIVRNDMINLLMQARKEGRISDDKDNKLDDAGFATVEESKATNSSSATTFTPRWDDDDLAAQCVIFFLAGFDTISTCMSFMGYELALNPDIQERLIQEIDDVREELDGKPLTYEVIQKMKYMDMFLSEILRKWPAGVATDRYCTTPYVIEDSDGTKVQLNVNDGLWIPIMAIHRDPKYFPNPELFDPERFSDENKGNIQPFTYMPFGVGPRNCIGSRFALMEAKAMFFHLLSAFTITPSPQTQVPLKLKKQSFNLIPEKDFWVHFNKREVKVQ